jgi:hypothetical protein
VQPKHAGAIGFAIIKFVCRRSTSLLLKQNFQISRRFLESLCTLLLLHISLRPVLLINELVDDINQRLKTLNIKICPWTRLDISFTLAATHPVFLRPVFILRHCVYIWSHFSTKSQCTSHLSHQPIAICDFYIRKYCV